MTQSLDAPYASDPKGMGALIESIPDHIEAALQRMAAAPWKLDHTRLPSTLAVGAMGGSAIAADLTAALYADRIMRPMVTVRDYQWPAFVTREAFALHCSYSGATEETLSLYKQSSHRSVPRAAITTGGALASGCDRDGVPWHRLPSGMPPRAALFASWVPITFLIAALDWCDDPTRDWRYTAERLADLKQDIGLHVPENKNAAKQLARAIGERPVAIYTSAGLAAPAGTRLRQQLNENAKMLGRSAQVPELNHNEIVGWERPSAGQPASVVLVLQDPDDREEIRRRLALTAEYVKEQGAEVHTLPVGGGSRLSRQAHLVMWGDYLSFYLAQLRGVDPTPVASIDEFKRRMAAAATTKES
jgi:glucose/mannose-6-phosphate isomerase